MPDPIEVACPECGAVNRYPAHKAGTTDTCPDCRRHVDIPSDTDRWLSERSGHDDSAVAANAQADEPGDEASIVLVCPFCDEHATFDTSAAGTTQSCPHCGEELEVLGSLVTGGIDYTAVYFRCDWCKRIARTDQDGLANGCECPHCGEANEPDDIADNRLTTGQAERLGLLPEPDTDADS